MSNQEVQCMCGSGVSYLECCRPFHFGDQIAETPDVLMRSRYAAFVLDEIEYLKKTWNPETLPEDLGEDEPSNWVGLEIIDWGMDEDEVEGEVEFKAKLIYGSKLETLHELSHFDKIDGKWLYHSGEFKNDGAHIRKLSKSEPCPCGSGKNFKNCHLNP